MFIPGLIGLWRLNEGSGLIARDLSGYGNDGVLEGNNPTWVDGISGKAVNFPGVNERIDCGNGSPLDQIGNVSFWFSFWMKSKDTIPLPYGVLFSKSNIIYGNYIQIGSSNIENKFRVIAIKDGNWKMNQIYDWVASGPFDTNLHHIILAVNKTTMFVDMYMDTVKKSFYLGSFIRDDFSNSANVTWGCTDDDTYPYEGLEDELYIFLGIPTQEQIQFLFDNPGGTAFSYKEKTSNLYTIVNRISNLFTKKEGDSNL